MDPKSETKPAEEITQKRDPMVLTVAEHAELSEAQKKEFQAKNGTVCERL